MLSAWPRARACPPTAARNASRSSGPEEGVAARRGPSPCAECRGAARSRRRTPAPCSCLTPSGRSISSVPRVEDVERVAVVAAAEEGGAARQFDLRASARRGTRSSGAGSSVRNGTVRSAAICSCGICAPSSITLSRRCVTTARSGSSAPTARSAPRVPSQVIEHGRGERAECERRDDRALEDAEDPARDLGDARCAGSGSCSRCRRGCSRSRARRARSTATNE